MMNVHAWCLGRSDKGIIFSEKEVTDGYELPCGSRELNFRRLQEQHLPLTAEPSLQLSSFFY